MCDAYGLGEDRIETRRGEGEAHNFVLPLASLGSSVDLWTSLHTQYREEASNGQTMLKQSYYCYLYWFLSLSTNPNFYILVLKAMSYFQPLRINFEFFELLKKNYVQETYSAPESANKTVKIVFKMSILYLS